MQKEILVIKKEAYKFSSAHMTVFPDGSKEALHGHNYQVLVRLGFARPKFKDFVDFKVFKQSIKALCDEWDEKVLLATKNPFYKVLKKTKAELEFELCGKRYVLPLDEISMLETDNISSENLAWLFLEKLQKKLKGNALLILEVEVFESSGQSVIVSWEK